MEEGGGKEGEGAKNVDDKVEVGVDKQKGEHGLSLQ